MIPWVFYQLCSLISRFCRKAEVLPIPLRKEDLPSQKLRSEAFSFARAELEKHPETIPLQFQTGWRSPEKTFQPCNPEISRLAGLLETVEDNFYKALAKNPNDPWSKEEVIHAADAYFKICYAISVLTLEDLPAFQEKLKTLGTNRTAAQSLTEQDSYQYRTFFYCPLAYNHLRGKATLQGGNLVFPSNPPSSKEIKPFFQSGTPQDQWRELYNDYCNRIQQTVSKEELRIADSRHVSWTKKDRSFGFIGRYQDTLPT